jgi:hypothetical protein
LVSDLIYFLLILGFCFDFFYKIFDFKKISSLNQLMLFSPLFLYMTVSSYFFILLFFRGFFVKFSFFSIFLLKLNLLRIKIGNYF